MPEQTPLHDATAQEGAIFAEDGGWLMPARYGESADEYRQARVDAAAFDVSHRGKIEVTGPDAASFLHNLCTNDIRQLACSAGCEAFLTTAKARVVAGILVYHVGYPDGHTAFWLDAPAGLGNKVYQHLDHYLISERLELADRTAEYAQVHLAGPRARAILGRVLGGTEFLELAPLQHVGAGGVLQVRRHEPLGLPGYDLVMPRDAAGPFWQQLLQAGARPAGLEAYDVLRVEAGTPAQGLEIDEDRFVVEVGRPQAICYSKGCYLGQEPIVMARDRGHVNRTLLGLRIQGAGLVPRVAKVWRDNGEVGQVTSSVVSPRLGTLALAYIRRGSQEPGTEVEVETAMGRRAAEVASLPFSGS